MNWTLKDVWGILAFVLMMIGITGLSWEVFHEGGWGGQLLGSIWEKASTSPLLVVFALVVAGGIASFLTSGKMGGKGNPFSEILVYVLMALGVYFIYRWVS